MIIKYQSTIYDQYCPPAQSILLLLPSLCICHPSVEFSLKIFSSETAEQILTKPNLVIVILRVCASKFKSIIAIDPKIWPLFLAYYSSTVTGIKILHINIYLCRNFEVDRKTCLGVIALLVIFQNFA